MVATIIVVAVLLGAALLMMGSGVQDWRAYAVLFLAPSGAWIILYGYMYARKEFYYYGGWGAVLMVGSIAAALTLVTKAIIAAGLALIMLAAIIVLAEAAGRRLK